MSKSTTYKGDTDEVESQTVGTNNVTVSFSRKTGRENYGGEEAFLSCQVDITEDDDLATIEGKIKGTYTFLKTAVYNELGLESVVNDSGIVRDVVQPDKPKASGGGRKPATTKASGGGADKTTMWQDVIDNTNGWFDNRVDKKNPKGPDFKGKSSGNFPDEALWLYAPGSKTKFGSDVPEFVKLWVNGEVEAA